jgi:hypothetical protein
VEEEESFQIHGADACGHVVCEGSEGERKEMRGSRDSKIVQVISSCECVKFQRMERCMREKQRKEGS